jgi:hypothetical protein
VSMAYLNSVERVTGTPGWIFPGFKWIAMLLIAGLTLLLSVANHVATTPLGLAIIGFLTVILVIGFFEMTELGLRNSCRQASTTNLKRPARSARVKSNAATGHQRANVNGLFE